MIRSSGTTNNLKAVDFIDDFNISAVGEYGKILKSTNGGINWFSQSSGTTAHLYSVSFANENYGVAVGVNGILLRTNNGGTTWEVQTSGTTNNLNSVSIIDENYGFAVGSNGIILKTTDGGISWMIQSSGLTNLLNSVSCVDRNNCTVVGYFGIILRTTDGGDLWTVQDAGSNYLLRCVDCCDSSYCIAVGIGNIVLKTTNAGSNWFLKSPGLTENLYGVYISDTLHINAVGSYGMILGSEDGGDSWMVQPGWTERNLYGVSFVNVDTGIVVGNNGVIRMTYTAGIPVELNYFTALVKDGTVELEWETASELNNHLFEIQRRDLETEYITIGYVEGSGTSTEIKKYKFIDRNAEKGETFYRLKQIDFTGTFEYSDELKVNATGPLINYLLQNYPNPFNPSTKISYTIKEKGIVSLKVFDMLGNQVAILVSGEYEAGNYTLAYEPSALASGIYFYTLKAGDFVSTRKMILLK